MEIRRTASDDNFEAISQIYAASWKTAYRGIVPDAYLDALKPDRWTNILAGSKYDSFVALDNGRYIGTVYFGAARDAAMEGWGEIMSIYVLPEYFGKGCGSALLNAAFAELRDMGFSDIYLWVFEKNSRARTFYERNGFSISADSAILNIGGEQQTEVRYVLHGL